MTEYTVYRLYYRLSSNKEKLYAEVSADDLTRAEDLLKESIISSKKSIEGYLLCSIEPTKDRLEKETVRFNTLN